MSGHASHKGSGAKPNPNAVSGQSDLIDGAPIDPQPEAGYPYAADAETEVNPAALERPDAAAPTDSPKSAS